METKNINDITNEEELKFNSIEISNQEQLLIKIVKLLKDIKENTKKVS